MEIKKIVNELEFYRGYYPEEALREAVARKEEITPLLLNTLKKSITNLPYLNQYSNFNGYIFAFYLLAQFREKEAFPLITEFFTSLENDPYDFTGDLVTETLDRILASAYNGELSTLQYVTLDQECEEFVRVAFLDAILILYKNDLIIREDMVEVYRSIFNNLESEKSYIWHSLVQACAIAGIDELKDLISKTYEDGLIDTLELPIEEIISSLESGYYRYSAGRNYNLIDDVIKESNWWPCYTRKPKELELYSGMTSLGKSIISEMENYYGCCPKDALNKAIENQEIIIPDLLRVIDWTAKNPIVIRNIDFIIPIISCYLLGKFQEKSAFSLIINFMTSEIYANTILTEFVFYDLSGILAACYNGDYDLLKEKILDENIHQEIRTSFLECIIVLYHRQEIERDIYIEILHDIFGRLEKRPSSVWNKMIDACIVSRDANFLPGIINAYVNDLIESWYSKKDIEEMFKGNNEDILDNISEYEEDICDTEWWKYVELGTNEKIYLSYLERKEDVLASLIENKKPRSIDFYDHYSEPKKPYERKSEKIGRNDPCPCGSGKKYKKCCGRN